jgi:starch phosphorylase
VDRRLQRRKRFSIGELKDEAGDELAIDLEDAESLYQVLETEIIPAFYNKDTNGLPFEWIRRMKNALITLTPQFSSDRMIKDYIDKIYN